MMEMMDGTDPRNTQDFEEMEAVKLLWLMRDICCRRQSLKEASKDLAISGIIVGILYLVGAGGNFIIAGLRSGTSLALGILALGILALLEGVFLLIFNYLLLNAVRDNRAVRVFKTIKVGCLTLLVVLLIGHLVKFSGFLALLILRHNDSMFLGVAIGGLVGNLLGLLLTILVLYAIIRVKPKIVTFYVNFFIFSVASTSHVIYSVVMVLFGSVPVVIINYLLNMAYLGLLCAYCVQLFAVHVNMMTITPAKNQYQPQNLKV